MVAVALAALLPLRAAERVIDLTTNTLNTPPKGFRSTLAGEGKPGDWRVLLDDLRDDAPRDLQPALPNAAPALKRAVIAQVSQDPTDERFPLLILEDEVFGDFTLTTKFKTVSGVAEQMAGIAFRLQDEKNFYVVRASSLGNTFRFYRVANGVRDNPIGPEIPISKGVWHELTVECKGNQIRLRLDGQEPIPALTDNTFSAGKIAFWTKSDSVSYFTDTRIAYTPRESQARELVRATLRRNPRLLGLKLYAGTTTKPELRVVASDDEKDLGTPAGKVENECFTKNMPFAGKDGSRYLVTLPLHDQNGDPVAVVRVVLRSFAGETDNTALSRATPIVRRMENQVSTLKELTQ